MYQQRFGLNDNLWDALTDVALLYIVNLRESMSIALVKMLLIKLFLQKITNNITYFKEIKTKKIHHMILQRKKNLEETLLW